MNRNSYLHSQTTQYGDVLRCTGAALGTETVSSSLKLPNMVTCCGVQGLHFEPNHVLLPARLLKHCINHCNYYPIPWAIRFGICRYVIDDGIAFRDELINVHFFHDLQQCDVMRRTLQLAPLCELYGGCVAVLPVASLSSCKQHFQYNKLEKLLSIEGRDR